ncbi:signal peptidase I [Paucisalibacillus globulus]|uniref:signal peptidase I n=1 Tax=Paucisalibacillus globulus TaxID=351095 RepID=UPI000427E51E|nr:signal peptidase I [Paucisalibacillus globulus]
MAKKGKSEWLDWIKALLIAFGLAFLVRTFLFTPIIVDGPSMQPTLHNKDQMIVNKFIYRFDEPERFDVVVFHANDKKDFIKRIIALPGEHVAYKDNILYINGQPIEEKFFTENQIDVHTNDFTLEQINGNYTTVPEGHVFVLGDNRTNSTDSRLLGPIPIEQIVGKASVIYWPFDRFEFIGE